MCGDIDEEEAGDEALRQRLRTLAARWKGHGAAAGAIDVASPAGRAAYMQARFNALIATLCGDLEGAPAGQAADVVGAQTVILGRLAGLLAAQLDARSDPLPQVLEALLYGYGERAEAAGHHHDHHHGHDHGHDHEH
jgi:hypothetical protein